MLTKPPPGVMDDPFHPLSQGCICHLLFNEGAGSLAYDVSGHGIHGVLYNMSPNAQNSGWCGSKFGGGLAFDGDNDYGDCGNNSLLDLTTALSITLWIKLNGDYTSQQGIINRAVYVSGSNNKGYALNFGQTDNEFIFYTMRDDAGSGLTSSISLLDNDWHFIVGTHDGVTKKIYFDGDLDVEQNYGPPKSITTDFTISESSNTFNGTIDDVRIHNRALNAQEIKQLYHDPFCNLMRVPAWQLYSPIAGLSIPVAMHQYEMLRA